MGKKESVARLLCDLITEADSKLERLRRQSYSDPSKVPVYLHHLSKAVPRREFERALDEFGAGDRTLRVILRIVARGKRPPMKVLSKVKGRLRKMPQFVQRLYALGRIEEILQDEQFAQEYDWSAESVDILPNAATALRRLRALPVQFTDAQFMRAGPDFAVIDDLMPDAEEPRIDKLIREVMALYRGFVYKHKPFAKGTRQFEMDPEDAENLRRHHGLADTRFPAYGTIETPIARRRRLRRGAPS